uniref:Uncharacterized protein n=1 Tax=Rhizophora mucronata TaxID=61149 RepID=A0A2P2NV13_RHIMU
MEYGSHGKIFHKKPEGGLRSVKATLDSLDMLFHRQGIFRCHNVCSILIILKYSLYPIKACTSNRTKKSIRNQERSTNSKKKTTRWKLSTVYEEMKRSSIYYYCHTPY